MALEALGPKDPASVGPYALRGRLGSGGMGVVYLGFDESGAPVALKTLHHGVDAEVRRRLRREAELLQAVDSDRVARFVAADTDADRPWIAMTYIAGPSLAEATVPLSALALRQLADGLADALGRLHAVGMTHRDVKPGNVILTFDGPVLVDLGIAHDSELTSFTAEGTTVGTPAWMAPEQLAGLAAGPATDVWGWASVIYYAATGRAPFGDGPVPALAYRIQHTQADVSTVPQWLQSSIGAALAKDPSARPSMSSLLDHTATDVLPTTRPPAASKQTSQIPMTTPPTVVITGPGRRSRRPLLIVSICAVALLVIGGAIALFVINSDGSRHPAAGGPTSTPGRTPSASQTPSTSAPSSTPSNPPITAALLRSLGDCGSTCIITGQVKFQDPVAGPSTLVTSLDHTANEASRTAYITMIDATAKKTWDDKLTDIYTLAPAPTPIDATGHIFLNYNPGRYNGVIVLTPTGGGVDDFRSLPTANSQGRFYSATATDTNKDGIFEIDVAANNCTPNCASGTDVHTVYHWTGTAYVAQATAPSASPTTTQPGVAKLDCKILSFGADNAQFEVSPGPGTFGHARVTLIERDRGIVFPDKPIVTVYPFGSESNFHPVPVDDSGASAAPDICTASPVS